MARHKTLVEFERERANHILQRLQENPRIFYRFFKGGTIDAILEAIQLSEFVSIPLATSFMAELKIGGRYKFRDKYYLIH